MKFKDIKANKKYVYEYTWILYDEEAAEFRQCDGCHAEVPLYNFSTWKESRFFCEICAESTQIEQKRHANFAANMVLRKLGVFDDYRVEVVEEEIEGE